MAAIWLCTPTNKHHVDVGKTMTWTSLGLESYTLPQVDICSRFTKHLGVVADLPLEPSWMLVDDHGSRPAWKYLSMRWWYFSCTKFGNSISQFNKALMCLHPRIPVRGTPTYLLAMWPSTGAHLEGMTMKGPQSLNVLLWGIQNSVSKRFTKP